MSVASTPTAHATGREKWLGHLALIGFAAMIAGSFSLGHKAAPFIGPLALNAVRFIVGVMLLMGLLLAITRRLPALPVSPWRFAILGGLMSIYFVLMFVALKITNPVSTGAVFTLTPLMSAGFAWLFLRQVTRPLVLIALLIGAAGAVWVIFRGDLAAIAKFDIGRGELIFLVGCVCHAAYTPLLRKFNRGESGLYFTAFMTAAMMIWLLVFGGRELLATDFTSLPPVVWITIFYLAIVTTAITFFLLQFAAQRLPASKVMAYGYLMPCFVILYEGLSGHGWPAPAVAAGALVTAMALVVLALAPDS